MNSTGQVLAQLAFVGGIPRLADGGVQLAAVADRQRIVVAAERIGDVLVDFIRVATEPVESAFVPGRIFR